jgi:hypothetical protein
MIIRTKFTTEQDSIAFEAIKEVGLVVEVSAASLTCDRGTKKRIYA